MTTLKKDPRWRRTKAAASLDSRALQLTAYHDVSPKFFPSFPCLALAD